MNLYQLLPLIIRIRDSEAGETLKDVVSALEEESQITMELIDGIKDLLSTVDCPTSFLTNLSFFLGSDYFGDWSEAKKRNFLAGVVCLYHIKSTKYSLYALLSMLEANDVTIYELWKTQIHEVFDYSISQDYEHTIRAARIQFRQSLAVDSTHDLDIESGGMITDTIEFDGMLDEAFLGYEDIVLDDVIGKNKADFIRSFYPVHVLDRPYGDTVEVDEDLATVSDLLPDGCFVARFSAVEDPIVIDDGSFYLTSEGACEAVGLEVTIYTTCDTTCETISEYGPCEYSCQAFCQNNCQLTYEFIK